MKIASKRTLDDMKIAAEPCVHGATWDIVPQMQIGTMGTTLLSTSLTAQTSNSQGDTSGTRSRARSAQ